MYKQEGRAIARKSHNAQAVCFSLKFGDSQAPKRERERLFRHKTKQHNNAISVIATSFVTGHQKRQTAHQCLATQIKKLKNDSHAQH